MASGVKLNSTNNSEMNIVYQGTSGATRTVVVPDKSFTVAGTDEVIGVGQTWQDVTASRALGVTYTNTTGKPIQVVINGYNSAAGTATFAINGVNAGKFVYTVNSDRTYSFIIPSGATYILTSASFTIHVWSELR